jgi:ribosome-associated heat shock protein Hsp15
MPEGSVRLDSFLWAARFFKTRSLAAQAIRAGKVEVNESRAKQAKPVRIGDRVRVRRGPFTYLVTVRALSERRGPASEAAGLYEEDAAGKAAREKLAQQLRVAPPPTYEGKGRPTKRDRRVLDQLQGDDDA